MYILEGYMQIRPDAPRWWKKTFVKVWYGGGFGTKTAKGYMQETTKQKTKEENVNRNQGNRPNDAYFEATTARATMAPMMATPTKLMMRLRFLHHLAFRYLRSWFQFLISTWRPEG